MGGRAADLGHRRCPRSERCRLDALCRDRHGRTRSCRRRHGTRPTGGAREPGHRRDRRRNRVRLHVDPRRFAHHRVARAARRSWRGHRGGAGLIADAALERGGSGGDDRGGEARGWRRDPGDRLRRDAVAAPRRCRGGAGGPRQRSGVVDDGGMVRFDRPVGIRPSAGLGDPGAAHDRSRDDRRPRPESGRQRTARRRHRAISAACGVGGRADGRTLTHRRTRRTRRNRVRRRVTAPDRGLPLDGGCGRSGRAAVGKTQRGEPRLRPRHAAASHPARHDPTPDRRRHRSDRAATRPPRPGDESRADHPAAVPQRPAVRGAPHPRGALAPTRDRGR